MSTNNKQLVIIIFVFTYFFFGVLSLFQPQLKNITLLNKPIQFFEFMHFSQRWGMFTKLPHFHHVIQYSVKIDSSWSVPQEPFSEMWSAMRTDFISPKGNSRILPLLRQPEFFITNDKLFDSPYHFSRNRMLFGTLSDYLCAIPRDEKIPEKIRFYLLIIPALELRTPKNNNTFKELVYESECMDTENHES